MAVWNPIYQQWVEATIELDNIKQNISMSRVDIETIKKIYKDKFLDIDLQFLFDNKESMQEVINSAGKGDNLRLFAQK